jgi:hypothetical protein
MAIVQHIESYRSSSGNQEFNVLVLAQRVEQSRKDGGGLERDAAARPAGRGKGITVLLPAKAPCHCTEACALRLSIGSIVCPLLYQNQSADRMLKDDSSGERQRKTDGR